MIRISEPTGLELDEGAELVRAQAFQFGYGTQPPLYTWLLIPLMAIGGPAIWPLALVKNLLLFGTHAFVYGSGRQLGLPVGTALLASSSMLLLPQIGWESQRDLTHTVLATFAAAASLFLVLRLLLCPTWGSYIILGLALAAGLLAKYNFVLFALALLLATLSVSTLRSKLFDLRIALTLGIILLIGQTHARWLQENWFVASQGSLDKMGVSYNGNLLAAIPALLFGILQFAAPFLVVAGAFLLTKSLPRQQLASGLEASRQLLDRYLLAVLGLLALMGLILGIHEFKGRWLQPLLFMLPLWLLATWDFDRLRNWQRRGFRLVVGMVAVLLLFGMLVQIHIGPMLGISTRFNAPMTELVAALDLPQDSIVITADAHLGGSLRLLRPDLSIFMTNEREPDQTESCYLIWPERGRDKTRFVEWLRSRFGELDAMTLQTSGQAVSVSIDSPDRQMTVLVAHAACAPAGSAPQESANDQTGEPGAKPTNPSSPIK